MEGIGGWGMGAVVFIVQHNYCWNCFVHVVLFASQGPIDFWDTSSNCGSQCMSWCVLLVKNVCSCLT